MDKKGGINWKEFLRVAVGVAATGGGVILVGSSAGKTLPLIIGLLLGGAGVALLMSER